MEKYPNKRLKFRDSKGRFTKICMNVDICSCGQIIPKKQINIGSQEFPLLKEISENNCPECGRKLN